MKRLFLIALLITFLIGCSKDPAPPFTFTPKPQIEGFYTSDIDLFWQAYDYMSPNFTKENFQNIYINNGTAGLKDYNAQKQLTRGLEQLCSLQPYREYYASIRANTLDLQEQIDSTKKAFQHFQELYPDLQLCDVYFLIGSLSAGGRVSNNGILIAVEFFTKTDQSDLSSMKEIFQNVIVTKDYLPSVAVHELAHKQQHVTPRNKTYMTLLEQSIREGMADFIALQVLPGKPFMDQNIFDHGETMEQQLWNDFKEEMNMNYKETDWLYNSEPSYGYPPNMGYYVGYKICEAYAAQFDTKEEAIAAMLQTSDYVTLFNQSGYDGGK